MEVRKPKEWKVFPEIREVKGTEELRKVKIADEIHAVENQQTAEKGSR